MDRTNRAPYIKLKLEETVKWIGGTKIISLWKYAIQDSILGKRGLVKRSSLLLPLALIIYSSSMNDLRAGFILAIYLIIAVQCWGMACTLVNDLSDIKEDVAAGKDRWISRISENSGILIIIITFVIGLLSIIVSSNDVGALISYVAAMALGSLYSIKPVRFKESGILGLLAYSISTTLMYVLVPWMIFHAGMILLIFLFFAVMLDKWVNLHFHQIVDFRADLNSGSQTYAVQEGIFRSRRTLQIASLLASLSMFIVLIYIILLLEWEIPWRGIISMISFIVLVAAGIYTHIMKRRSKNVTDLVRELPWIYLGLTFLLFRVMPPILFTHMAIKEQWMWILAVLSILSLLGESIYAVRYKYE